MRRSVSALLMVLAACQGDTTDTGFGQPSNGEGESSGSSGSSGFTPTGDPLPTSGTTGGGASDAETMNPLETTQGPAATSSDETTSTSSSSSEPSTTSVGETSSDATSSDDTTTGPAPETCEDAKHNQDETDFDCGGSICGPCGLNAKCEVDVDCTSGWCDAGKCGDPGCLADSDCDEFDLPCAEAMCNVETKFCDIEAVKEGEPCEDGDLCTSGELCGGGACGGGVALDCSDLTNVCGIGLCDDQTGTCKADPIPDMVGVPCDDGWVCTPDDTCVDGVCGVGGPGYLWFEDFTEPDPGWVLGDLWQIGAAKESIPGKNGKDPGTDHTPNNDEMLAGTSIGLLVDNGEQAKTCLTSPVIDASAAPELWLSFWRHLHTDYFPFAIQTVEVWNNNDWTVVDIGYGNPGVDDPQWKQVAFDLTTFANAALQVRVCLQHANGAKAAGGWSVDDLTLGPFVCTPDK